MTDHKIRWKPTISYALFDAGNSALGAIHSTFIFAVYFVTSVAPENGTAYWGYMTAAAAIFVALISPILGGIADSKAIRKFFLFLVTIVAAISAMILWVVKPDANYLFLALVLSFFTIAFSELMFVFYNSLLPSVAPSNLIGRVSGWSWGVGYWGAIIALSITLFFFIKPESAPFGLNKDNAEHIRITMVFVGLWMIFFSFPLFFFVKENAPASKIDISIKILKQGWLEISKIPGLRKFLIARLFYTDGLTVVFAFAGIYAAKVFGFSNELVLLFAIAVNFTCGIGAFVGGWVDDKVGSFLTIRISLFFLTIFGIGVLIAPSGLWFWVLGLIVGLFIGPVQSASRSLISHKVPPEHRAQIFGFYMLSGKITSFLGPTLYASIVLLTNNERAGMVTAVLFFIVGLFVLGNKEPGSTYSESILKENRS